MKVYKKVDKVVEEIDQRKCDDCGSYIEESNYDHSSELKITSGYWKLWDIDNVSEIEIDLCKDCMKEIFDKLPQKIKDKINRMVETG